MSRIAVEDNSRIPLHSGGGEGAALTSGRAEPYGPDGFCSSLRFAGGKGRDRGGGSGEAVFLRRYARKNHDLGGAKTFLAIHDEDNKTILGFYSLAPASVEYARTPEIVKRSLAAHDVPGSRLVRLALDHKL